MDKEHTKYVRATVSRLNYLLSAETDTRGLVVQLLNKIAEEPEVRIRQTGEKMNLSQLEILSEKSLYKRKKARKDFISQMAVEEEAEDLDREDVLRLNRIQMRYSKKQIEEFIEDHMEDGVMDVRTLSLEEDETFEKLILAYDYSTRRNSKYRIAEEETEMITSGKYRYPALRFIRRGI